MIWLKTFEGYYPASGSPTEVGNLPSAPSGTVNVAWGLEPRGESGANRGDGDYMAAFKYLVMPILQVSVPAMISILFKSLIHNWWLFSPVLILQRTIQVSYLSLFSSLSVGKMNLSHLGGF
jgi:hypothetical protein